ncbi:hypothetical protein Tco_0590352 [Tanacetum coccineum]
MATITCLSAEAHTFIPDCNEVVNAAANKDTRDVPIALKQVENTTYIFHYQFDKGPYPNDPDFTLDVAFKSSRQPLLSLPAPNFKRTLHRCAQRTSFATTNVPITFHYLRSTAGVLVSDGGSAAS